MAKPEIPGRAGDEDAGGGRGAGPSWLAAFGAGPATGVTADGDSAPSVLMAALARLAAGVALTLLVFGLAITPYGLLGHVGDSGPVTVLIATVWSWALVAAMFVLVCRDHPWVPGAALGLLAGMAGMFANTVEQIGGRPEVFWWLVLGMTAVAVAVACRANPWWLASAGGVLGAAGVFVLTSWADELESIDGDEADVVFIVAVIGLVGLAGYRVWREKAWMSLGAPALLLLGAVLTLSASVPEYVLYASLAELVVVPLIATLTSGVARFAGYLAVVAGLLVRANEYVSGMAPSFTSVAHVVLPLAAAVVAYFSRSR